MIRGCEYGPMGWRDWTGVGERRWKTAPDEQVQPAKTLWDWLQLLIVPAILIAVTFAWSATQTRSDNKREDRRIAADESCRKVRQDATLQAYLDQMSDLMLDRETADLQGRAMRSGRSRVPSPSPPFAAWTESEKAKSYASCKRPISSTPAIPRSRPEQADLQGADLAGADLQASTSRTPTSGAPTSRTPTSRTPTSGRQAPGRQPQHADLGVPTSRAPTSRAPTSRTPTSGSADLTEPTSRAPTSRAPTSRTPTSGRRPQDAKLKGAIGLPKNRP